MNKLTIIGNVVRDGELRSTQAGVSVCTFTVAVNPKYKREGDEDKTQYFKVTAWRKLGENCGKFVKKGMKVAIVGSVEVQTYTDNKGNFRADLAVTADDVEFLSRVEHSDAEDYSQAPEVPQAQQSTPQGFTDVSDAFDTDSLPF